MTSSPKNDSYQYVWDVIEQNLFDGTAAGTVTHQAVLLVDDIATVLTNPDTDVREQLVLRLVSDLVKECGVAKVLDLLVEAQRS